MSTRIPIGSFETILHFSAPGQDGDIITSFGWSGEPDEGSEFLAIESEMNVIMGNINNHVVLTTIDVVVGSSNPVDRVFSIPSGVGGGAGGSMLPINNAFLVQKLTPFGGRRFRGRAYLPGVSEGAADDSGQLDSGVADGLQANIDSMVAGMDGINGYTPRLFHQSSPFTPSPVTVLNVSPFIATQRGRLSRG